MLGILPFYHALDLQAREQEKVISYHMLAARSCSSYLINSELNKEITYIYKLHFWNNQLLGFSTVLSRPH